MKTSTHRSNSRNRFWIIFWIFHILIFFVSTYLAVYFYPKAFPIVDINIKMDRTGALKKAEDIAHRMSWGPASFRQAASFNLDSQTQTFIELTAGGSQAFSEVIKKHLFEPYTWVVRQFAEGNAHETLIWFTPQGELYDFHLKIPATDPGPALNPQQALTLAEKAAEQTWGLSLTAFELIEKSKDTRSSGRVDHSFTYQRKNEKIGEGNYRLRLVVSGDRLSEISHYVKIPESFIRNYTGMRSYNDLTKSISVITMIILYFLGGCCFGLFYLARKKWILWKAPLVCAAIVALLTALEQLNQFPLLWLGYDTALSANSFILKSILSSVMLFFGEFLLLSVSFMAAEGLTRKAFPKQIQLWKIWKPENASTWTVLGQTVGGYLSVGFFFAFVVLIYIIGNKYLGWWTPSDILYQPNGLASYFPWLTAIANSFHAGFWEECLFRALPLAGAALLGQHFGGRKIWIGFALVIQALVFASAHADYPAQPYYARVVELIIPSIFFGSIYILFGLLPGIILHFTFDVVSFSIPIFSASTPYIRVDQGMIIFLSLIPLWIVLVSRFKVGKWQKLNPQSFNLAWTPKKTAKPSKERRKLDHLGVLGTRTVAITCVLSLVSLGIWLTRCQSKIDTLPLEVGRALAISIASKALEDKGIHLSPDWQPLSTLGADIGLEEKFVWKTESPHFFRFLTGKYLEPPAWVIRFVRFHGTLEERAEEYQVTIIGKGDVYGINHELPEEKPGKSLSQEEAFDTARKMALALMKKLDLPTSAANEFLPREESSNPSQLPNRRDWFFIFSDPRIHFQWKDAQARVNVHISGDEVTSVQSHIYVPEEWRRQERKRQDPLDILATLSSSFLGFIFLVGFIMAIVSWTRKQFDTRAAGTALVLLIVINTVSFLNHLPSRFASFTTDQPELNQLFTLFSFGAIKILLVSACSALFIGYFHQLSKRAQGLRSKSYFPIGFFLGTLGVSLGSFVAHTFKPDLPAWGKVDALNTYLAPLTFFGDIERFIFTSLFIFLINIFYHFIIQKENRHRIFGTLFVFVVGLCIQGVSTDSFTTWACLGASTSIILWVLFRFFIRHHVSLIPWVAAGISTLAVLKQMNLHAYPDVTAHGILSILSINLVAYFWFRRLEETSERE